MRIFNCLRSSSNRVLITDINLYQFHDTRQVTRLKILNGGVALVAKPRAE